MNQKTKIITTVAIATIAVGGGTFGFVQHSDSVHAAQVEQAKHETPQELTSLSQIPKP
ncbi:hypothetical protein GHI93_05640 [Lactococcus hircilactis]|uniref:Uncharacterized protein n=1 Tax=Lactococcus hircilactis TaxID=1494462 RepID=A0A7X1Z9U8_9LACT|nr:hypothetical protein [Lactococcus hircilactis]MQW39421.1 hypothetical protein [Lactococcus hircilactis]